MIDKDLMPNSPQAQYEVQKITEVLTEYARSEEAITANELALRVWRAAKEIRPVKGKHEQSS